MSFLAYVYFAWKYFNIYIYIYINTINTNTITQNTISIVGRTELEDVRVDSDGKSDVEKSIVNVGMTGQLISSGNISLSEELIMSADNINACTTEWHGNIYPGVDENHLGEEIISNNQQSFNSREKQSKDNVPLLQQDTSLIDILTPLLQDKNTVQALNPSVITSTTGDVSTHGNSTSCFKTEQKPPPASSERVKVTFVRTLFLTWVTKFLAKQKLAFWRKVLGLYLHLMW